MIAFGYFGWALYILGFVSCAAGLQVEYDVAAPVGRRVVSAAARCGDCSVPTYRPVQAEDVYGLVTNNFIVDGGDGYNMFKGAPTIQLGVCSCALVLPPTGCGGVGLGLIATGRCQRILLPIITPLSSGNVIKSIVT